MKIENKFYLSKQVTGTIFSNLWYRTEDGELINSNVPANVAVIEKRAITRASLIRIETDIEYTAVYALCYDANNDFISSKPVTNGEGFFTVEPFVGTHYIAFDFTGVSIDTVAYKGYVSYEIVPHYKQLKKKFKKESQQAFFRESLDGKINLFGSDYELVSGLTLEDNAAFEVYRNGNLYASATFTKSDCKFDRFKKLVELGLKYNDAYTKILDAYENTYDLIKLAPFITPLTLTKRSILQIYMQGENTISSYSGGTYWESEVLEVVNNASELQNKYFFHKGPKYIEIDLTGFNYAINATYMGLWESDTWESRNGTSVYEPGQKYHCFIKFEKVGNADDPVVANQQVLLMSDGTSVGHKPMPGGTQNDRLLMYDTYKICVYFDNDEQGRGLPWNLIKMYESNKWYGKDTSQFILAQGQNLYPMTAVYNPSVPQRTPSPQQFNLGEYVIEYQIWARLLCDIDKLSSGEVTHDLPYDDFATPRRNYKKCIGLAGFGEANSFVKIFQNKNTVSTPTAYGINELGEYFIAPSTTMYGNSYVYPLARNSWANTSLWIMLDEMYAPEAGFEAWNKKSYKEYTLRNSYHIADVIKALLQQIDPTITHEKTAEYSQFLYGHTGATASALGGCDAYITQKTNILKGEYDQAAQKAEIKFKQVMDMLRDCFRCYWYIDSNNRLIIEHVSYFMNGFSYSNPSVQLNLIQKQDKFNKKAALYCQQELEYDKSNLPSRFEFAWMDDVTDSMGNLHIDINNNYVQKDSTEEINIDGFTTDVDYMLFMPDDFSNDGFALLLAQNGKVPIVHTQLRSEIQFNRLYDVYPQNWYASWNKLARHYMLDMPGNNISYNSIESLTVSGIVKSMKHDIEFPASEVTVNPYGLIITEIGHGTIEEISENIDTGLITIELRYEPE